MTHTFRSTKGALLLACVLVGAAPLAWAQDQSQAAANPSSAAAGALPEDDPSSTAPSARNQRIERLSHEDAGSRVDELRVGGRTKSVTVTPKTIGPEYEIVPNDPSRSRADGSSDSASPAGRRVWRLGTF
ncbi:MAG: hypothetical protein GAK30_02287 [Paracidovorax wautersii]|uniref:DUF2782 domain-containing protein n=1 Tax=Paracidovorax wautersii TaxID=1177982 RepID=A0A7V8FNA6_9BURK|nr:MAG: hypothetical protein GAK30_02287 [Paracidovorax wautersii]